MTPKKKIVIKEIEKIWLSQKEAAEYLGMGQTYVVSLRKNGIIPYSRIGNSVFFKKTDIDAVLESNMVY